MTIRCYNSNYNNYLFKNNIRYILVSIKPLKDYIKLTYKKTN